MMGGINFFQPNAGPDQPCPICGSPRPSSERYPNHVCAECVDRAVDENGRGLSFSNADLSGGFVAVYTGTGEPREGGICFVDGIRCEAREARFGGVVVIPTEPPQYCTNPASAR